MKAAQNFGDIYPDMCKKYFDLLAKKRFNSDEKSEGDSRKKSKSVLEKKYEENNKPGDPDPEKLPNLGVSGRARARLGTF